MMKNTNLIKILRKKAKILEILEKSEKNYNEIYKLQQNRLKG